MHVKFVARENVRKARFGDIKNGTVFRKVELVGGKYEIVDPDTFFLKVGNSPNLNRDERSNAISLCADMFMKVRFGEEALIQGYDDTVLTIRSVE